MKNEALELLKQTHAVLTDDHFVGTSGKHMATYINKDALYPHTEATSRMGELFAEKNKGLDIDVVAAPALGGIILSTWTAYHLSKLKGREVLGIYTEKTPDKNQIFTRGYDKLVTGKNVLVIEDLTTTGGSVKKVVESVKAIGGKVVGVSVMVNKNPEEVTSESIGAPLTWLAELKTETYDESDCPLCKQGVPINTNVGHGKKLLESMKQTNDIQAVIFDIDHTLLNTEQFIFKAYRHTLKTHKLPTIKPDDLKKLMGHSLESTYEKLAPHVDKDTLSETHRVWQANNLTLAIPFPHTIETLKQIKQRGLKIAAVTTRSVRNSEETLQVTGILPFIDVVISKEHVKPTELKPHPKPLLLALEKLEVSPSNAVMIGDTKFDVEAGKRAGTQTIGVTYGSSGNEIKESNPDYVVNDIAEVINILIQPGISKKLLA